MEGHSRNQRREYHRESRLERRLRDEGADGQLAGHAAPKEEVRHDRDRDDRDGRNPLGMASRSAPSGGRERLFPDWQHP